MNRDLHSQIPAFFYILLPLLPLHFLSPPPPLLPPSLLPPSVLPSSPLPPPLSQGCVVDVQLQSGLVYEGILRTVSPQMDIVLEVAHIKTSVSVVRQYTRYPVWFGREEAGYASSPSRYMSTW